MKEKLMEKLESEYGRTITMDPVKVYLLSNPKYTPNVAKTTRDNPINFKKASSVMIH